MTDDAAMLDAASQAAKSAKLDKRLRQTLDKYRAAAPPGAFRAALAEGLDAAALASPEGLAQVQAELRALKHERRALRRLENLILSALGRAAPDEADDD